MRLSSRYTLRFLCFIQTGVCVFCLNVTAAGDLYSQLLTDYNKNLLPIRDQTETAEIGVSVYLLSLNSFDELSGELSVSVLFNLTWKEERMSWLPKTFGGKETLLISPDDMWTPRAFIRESFQSVHEVGSGSEMLLVTHNGSVVSTQGTVLKVMCPVDVTFFPFDSQTCMITLATLTVRGEHVKFYSKLIAADMSFWKHNSQWKFQNSSIFDYAVPYGPAGIIINITLKRRSEFYIIYIVIPLVFLGVINNLVFYMPVSSGERSSVAITTFLSFAVYMQIVNNSVPQSSSPIAYIYYYLMFLLLYSSYIMFACIVSMRIYDRKGKVSVLARYIVICLRCLCCTRNRRIGEVIDQQSSTTSDDEVTWYLVGKTFDMYCLTFNFLIYFVFTAATFFSLYTNAGVIKSFSVDDI